MVDVENQVYTKVYNAVIAAHPDVFMTGTVISAPEALPCVFFYESGNLPRLDTRTTSSNEVHSDLTYTAEVYSASGKIEAKRIAAKIDDTMQALGFTRSTYAVTPNMYDASVFRIVLRFKAVIDRNQVIYRN